MPDNSYQKKSLEINKLRPVVWILSTLVGALSVSGVHALGTAPATVISNQADVTFSDGGPPVTVPTNAASFPVDEMLDYTLSWVDPANVAVASGQTDAVLTFDLANNGNGSESFSLSVNNVVGGDNFDPVFSDIYLDDGDGVFNIATDTLYNPGVNDPVLAADASLRVFVRNNIPLALANNDLGDSILTARARTTGTAGVDPIQPAGTAFNCDGAFINGEDGGDGCVNPAALIDALSLIATDVSATGTYVISDVAVTIGKSYSISDPFGGNLPMTGATITYTLTVTSSGTGTASGVVVTDSICSPGPFPACANTSYIANTLRLNGVLLTDVNDGDVGNYNDPATTNLITVNLGDMTAATPVQTITFDVLIN